MPIDPNLIPSRICVALRGDSMVPQAEALATSFPFFEFRLDTAADPYDTVFDLGALLRRRPALRVIATCRRRANGGEYDGTAADEIEMLRKAVTVGAHIVDLSLETAEESAINPHALAPLRRGSNALLLSWHDFNRTPDLSSVLSRMHGIGADLYKLVPTAQTLTDSLNLLDFLKQHGHAGNLVAMSMGIPGILTRILGPRSGAVFTFASGAAGAETAPGQVDAASLRDLYRIDRIDSGTELYGVFGNPITGSRSPIMLNTAFRHTGRNAVYLPLQCDAAGELFATWDRLPLTGASVTMPLKERILPGLQNLSAEAERMGAANTLSRAKDGTTLGSNTDAIGIVEPLSARIGLPGANILVLGAGGAARAAVFALRREGANVFILNRTVARAEELADASGAAVLARGDLKRIAFDAILNGTPYGMATQSIEPPLAGDDLRCRVFFDLVYNPIQTPLLQQAKNRGIAVIPGVEMFLAQGTAQFTRWTGQPAPVGAMRAAVLASLT